MEGVAEAVAAPGVLAEVFFEGAEDADAVVGEEGKRACGGAGDDRSVDRDP